MPRRAALALVGALAALAGCTDDEAPVTARVTTTVEDRTTTSSTSTTRAEPVATTTTSRLLPPTTTESPPRPYAAAIRTVTADDLYASWRPGCPVPVEQLRALDVRHFGNDGAVRTGRLIVHADLAAGLVEVFRDLYDERFPIERMEPIDKYGGDDMRSIKANNTSAFNCRAVTGGTRWSEHAHGRAIDVNPFVNPYVKGSTVLPPEAAPYADRSRDEPGMIHADDAVVRAFAARGWRWGGYWSSLKDYQHFSTTGR